MAEASPASAAGRYHGEESSVAACGESLKEKTMENRDPSRTSTPPCRSCRRTTASPRPRSRNFRSRKARPEPWTKKPPTSASASWRLTSTATKAPVSMCGGRNTLSSGTKRRNRAEPSASVGHSSLARRNGSSLCSTIGCKTRSRSVWYRPLEATSTENVGRRSTGSGSRAPPAAISSPSILDPAATIPATSPGDRRPLSTEKAASPPTA
mmetsp:Transcript_3408/g.9710  ORF Transcript_3408/g.9710 Transcript_3408/m.9710 type:complete len:210 (-) Transcript_3408:438-1067(-)